MPSYLFNSTRHSSIFSFRELSSLAPLISDSKSGNSESIYLTYVTTSPSDFFKTSTSSSISKYNRPSKSFEFGAATSTIQSSTHSKNFNNTLNSSHYTNSGNEQSISFTNSYSNTNNFTSIYLLTNSISIVTLSFSAYSVPKSSSQKSTTTVSISTTTLSPSVVRYSEFSIFSPNIDQSTLTLNVDDTLSNDPMSVYEDKSSVFVIYVQEYKFTDKTTTFSAGFRTTTSLPKSDLPTSTFKPCIITTDAAYYRHILTGSDFDSADSSGIAKYKAADIAGGVVVGVVGTLVCCVILWFFFFRKRSKNNNKSSDLVETSFSHSLGRQINNFCGDNENISKTVPGMTEISRNTKLLIPYHTRDLMNNGNYNSTGNQETKNIFQDEFNFSKRSAPHVPPPRKTNKIQNIGSSEEQNILRYSQSSSFSNSTRLPSIPPSSIDSSAISGFSLRSNPFDVTSTQDDNNNRTDTDNPGLFREVF